jgi:alkylation response protein AidB-like acyl-CoA dehydrogenase
VIPRLLFSDDHEMFRDVVRRFVETEMVPQHASWESAGMVPRSAWLAAGEAGLLCCNVSEEFGGPGGDFLFNVVVVEELARAGITAPGFAVHSDMVATYIDSFGTDEQRHRWLPGMVKGEFIGCLALTEPNAGSDLRGLLTRAVREGDEFVINGQKTYISNGQNADVAVVCAKVGNRLTLFLVDASTPGFERGRRLEKLGLRGQDTSELFFRDLRVPASALLGPEGDGLRLMTRKLAQERLIQAIRSAALIESVLEKTVEWVKDRRAFGRRLAEFQNTQFRLAELKTQAVAARVFTDRCVSLLLERQLSSDDAAMVKLFLSDLHCRVVDECLQFFGGYGYMWESFIARAYADARVVRIAGGSVEIMKQIIARSMLGTESPRAPEGASDPK